MGQILSSPVTQKLSEIGKDERYLYSVTEMQGWRITMEDAHAAVLNLDETKDSNTFFAVYDGHGGGTVAKFAGQHVHKRLVTEESYHERQYETALKRAFLGTDEDILANPAHTRDPSGCTAVAALITSDGKVYVANAGDSRSVIGIKGEVKPLSFDHKPSNEIERARITGAGGYIEYGRVNGNLALSRALGDFEFKKNYSMSPERQVITADPDVTCHEITEDDEFLVLACDGIWDCLSSQQVVDVVRYQISQGMELSEIGEMICELCLAPDTTSGAGIGCDNMTVLIVALLHGRTKEDWYAWVTDRVKNGYGYETPSKPPQIYAQSRLISFRARREAQEARQRQRAEYDNESSSSSIGSTLGGLGLSRILGGGPIAFDQVSGVMSSGVGTLMFGNQDDDDDDDDDDDSDEDTDTSRSFFRESLGLGRPESPDPTKNLKAKLDEFEKDIRKESDTDEDGDSQMDDGEEPSADGVTPKSKGGPGDAGKAPLQGEAPSPPKSLPNGDAKHVSPEKQLVSTPGGDELSPVLRVEGFIDSSEDPLKG